jgi:hypothetical protein
LNFQISEIWQYTSFLGDENRAMFCTFCGIDNTSTQKTCRNCGMQLSANNGAPPKSEENFPTVMVAQPPSRDEQLRMLSELDRSSKEPLKPPISLNEPLSKLDKHKREFPVWMKEELKRRALGTSNEGPIGDYPGLDEVRAELKMPELSNYEFVMYFWAFLKGPEIFRSAVESASSIRTTGGTKIEFEKEVIV